jgi:uncharacterized surface protein with fasciclin (FAS1) repeats
LQVRRHGVRNGDVQKLYRLLGLAAVFTLAGCATPTSQPEPAVITTGAATNSTVGGAVMDASLSFAANAAKSRDHTTLLSAVRAAGLEATLSSSDQYTLFAPTNDAFARLPNGTVQSLMDPSNRWLLGRLVRYHLVPGAKTRSQMMADVRSGGGIATYRTVEGGIIRISLAGDRIVVADTHGNRNDVSIADVRNANGVMHVLNGVLLPQT